MRKFLLSARGVGLVEHSCNSSFHSDLCHFFRSDLSHPRAPKLFDERICKEHFDSRFLCTVFEKGNGKLGVTSWEASFHVPPSIATAGKGDEKSEKGKAKGL